MALILTTDGNLSDGCSSRTIRAEDARQTRVILMLPRDQQLGITEALQNVT
jgi:hypothetical protein